MMNENGNEKGVDYNKNIRRRSNKKKMKETNNASVIVNETVPNQDKQTNKKKRRRRKSIPNVLKSEEEEEEDKKLSPPSNKNNSPPVKHQINNNRSKIPVIENSLDVDASSLAKDLEYLSTTSFASMNVISKATRDALEKVLKFSHLTSVQESTFTPIFQGKDVVAKAKTGSGKTIAFLLPILERYHLQGLESSQKNGTDALTCLILSPTRELAYQIGEEAKSLLRFHPHRTSGCVVGGINIKKDAKILNDPKLFFLIATPGRLIDHLTSNNYNILNRLHTSLRVLVLDEADRLLDMGFRKEIEKILDHLKPASSSKYDPSFPPPPPSFSRQTILFSATFPPDVATITQLAMSATNQVVVDMLEQEDPSKNKQETNAQVKEYYTISPNLEQNILIMENLLLEHMKTTTEAKEAYKIIVFFSTARVAGFMAELFQAFSYSVLEMHSRKSQSHRNNVAKLFREGKNVILFSSDVSARGVDYPDVTLILQVGLTADRESYIHRLGRTGRAGKVGQGILLLTPFERKVMLQVTLKDLPLEELQHSLMKSSATTTELARVLLTKNLPKHLVVSAERAYQAWLGYYNSNLRRLGWDKKHLIEMGAEYSLSIGLKKTPQLPKKTIGKMGLKGFL